MAQRHVHLEEAKQVIREVVLTDVGETTFALPFCQVGIARTPTLLSGQYGLSRLRSAQIAHARPEHLKRAQ